jgi:hypothetical protein
MDADSDAESPKGILVAERLAGVRSPGSYHWAMAVIAAQDAMSHPVAVPPERL